MARLPGLNFAKKSTYSPLHFERPELPWRPEKSFLLLEVVEIIGRNSYANGWSGQELIARKLENFPNQINWGIRKTENYAPPGSNTKFQFQSPFFEVHSITGTIRVQTHAEAVKLWCNAELPKLEAAYKSEKSARQRFEVVVSEIRNALFQGDLSSHVIDRHTGTKYDVPISHWGAEKASEIFEMGADSRRWHNPGVTKFMGLTPNIVV